MKSRCLTALAVVLLVPGCGHSSHSTVVPVAPSQSATGSVHPPGWGVEGPPAALLTLAPSSTATMYDTVTVSTVPHDPFALAGYTGGWWPTFGALTRTWPRAHTVSIAISARERADCLDVEPGDATAGDVPGWVRAEKRAGHPRPCVYSDWSEYVGQIRPVLERAGIHRSQVWEWDAHYTFTPHIDPGFDGTQWTDRAFGRNLDASLVLRSFLSIAHPPLNPTPKPKPRPIPKRKPSSRRGVEHAHLKALDIERAKIRRHLLNAGCRVKHPRPACTPLRKRGAAVNREIRVLKARGVK
jgi:hypothetical protein